MKQYITLKQLTELSEKGKKELRRYWENKKGVPFMTIDEIWLEKDKMFLPLLSIGQMIEFLDNNTDKDTTIQIEKTEVINKRCWVVGFIPIKRRGEIPNDPKYMEPKSELVDMLWEAIKEVLEE